MTFRYQELCDGWTHSYSSILMSVLCATMLQINMATSKHVHAPVCVHLSETCQSTYYIFYLSVINHLSINLFYHICLSINQSIDQSFIYHIYSPSVYYHLMYLSFLYISAHLIGSYEYLSSNLVLICFFFLHF